MPGYQHWVPKAYLRGFVMPKRLFREHKATDPGLSAESLFLARLPDLTSPELCEGFKLEWEYANLSEIGGSDSLHSTDEADEAADADLPEFGRVMGEIRREVYRRASLPPTPLKDGAEGDYALPNPVHPLLSVIDVADAALLLRVLATAKFRGPYGDSLRVRDFFEKVLTGAVEEAQLRNRIPEGHALWPDVERLLAMRREIVRANPNGRELRTMQAIGQTLGMGRRYLPDTGLLGRGHSLLPPDEDVLRAVRDLAYVGADDMYLVYNEVPWTCDAAFFGIAPTLLPPAGDVDARASFHVSVQLSRDIYLTSSDADVRNPGLFFGLGRTAPLASLAQWLIAPVPLDEVCLMVSSRPWEREPSLTDELYGFGRVPMTFRTSPSRVSHWTPRSTM